MKAFSGRRPKSNLAISTARGLRKRMTRQEAKLWARLRLLREQGLHFRRQAPIGPFIVDFVCLRARTVIEIDGGGHVAPIQAARDVRRDEVLSTMGFVILRFWNEEVDSNADGIVQTIFERCATRMRNNIA